MKKLEVLFGVLRVPVDALAVGWALMVSYQLRLANIDLVPGVQLLDPAVTLPSPDVYLRSFVLPGALVFLVIAALLRLYAFVVTRSAWVEVGRLIVAGFVWLACVMAWYFLIRKQLFYSRILLLHSVLFIMLFTVVCRSWLVLLYRLLLRLGYGVRRVASVGRHGLPVGAQRTLQDDARYAFAGHVEDLPALRALSDDGAIDLVLHTDPHASSEESGQLIEYCRSQHVAYAFLPPVLADSPHQLAVERLGLLPMIRFQPTPLDGWGRVFKRLFDVVGSLILLVILAPLFALVALAIFLESDRPIFYVSRRIGDQGRRRIPVLKFRSMRADADLHKEELAALNHRSDGPLFKVKDDPRITHVGRFLRRFDIDEFPQLLNVLLGHMSLIGPRPHLPEEVDRYTPYQRRVFAVRPGMTGLAQVSGRSDLRFEDEVRLDLQYVEEWSMLLDLWILWRTAFVILRRPDID